MNASSLTIRLFGGVRAFVEGDTAVDVGPAKCQTILAALALSPGSPVPMARLVELVWGQQPPRSAERTLQSYIARLRQSLGPGSITRTGSSYRLDLAADAVDVARFECHLDAGAIEDALAEWTGPPLGGLEAPGLGPTLTAITERWLSAVEHDLERRVNDDPAAAISPLTELTAQHPFREGLWALLMVALYKSGRQADALAAYRSAHERLVEQLGLEPGPRLQELEGMILGHDERLGPDHKQRPPSSGRPTGTVTFAFTSIEDAKQWWASHPSVMPSVVAEYHELVHTGVSQRGGFVFSAVDDAFGVAFPRPETAVAWADDLHAAMTSQPWPSGVKLRVRVGLHTGGAEEHRGGYFGPVVNLAAGLSGIGHGGQTLVSSATAGLLSGVELCDLGTCRLDNVLTDQRVYQIGSGQHPPLRTESHRQGNLPRPLGPLIGRDETLTAIAAALAAYPIVTLVGPGGIGKTQLALTAANGLNPTQEAWLVELAKIRSSDHLPRAVADTLGIQDQPGTTLTGSIIDALHDRRVLLVLDNCEHVIEAAADLAQAIAQRCSHVRLLVTSRERLGTTNERIITIAPLQPTGSAAELFNQRASAITATFDADTSRAQVENICRRLDGIPLAIELAAARATSLSPGELLERLDRHRGLRLLIGGARIGSDRHATLWGAIQWSYDLLTPPEQELFQRLSIFAGSFDLSAAEAIATDPPLDTVDVDRLLGHLVDQSMVTIESGPFGRRFRILEPIRDFGTDCLLESEQADRVATRHTSWCLTQVEAIGSQLAGWDEIEGVARLEEIWPSLRTTFDRACTNHDRHLARTLVRPILGEIVLRSRNEIGDWIERILTITPPDDQEMIIFGLYWAAHRYTISRNPDAYQRLVERYGEPEHIFTTHGQAFLTRDYRTMAQCLPQVAAELRRQGDHHLAERADLSVATALLNLGRFTEHDELANELVERFRQQGPPTFLNWTLMLLGYSASFQGQPHRADNYFNQAINIQVPPRTHTPNRPVEAQTAFRRGDHIHAVRVLRAHIDEVLATDNMQAGYLICIEFINMMTSLDQLDPAARILSYLETTGLLETPGWRTLITDAAQKLASKPRVVSNLDHHQAHGYMAQHLDQLITGTIARPAMSQHPRARP